MCSLQAGEQLDHYILESVAAHSGMATIFRAKDTRTGQQVAIKVPHLEMESDLVFFERFRREEEIGRMLDHPGIAKVLQAEKTSVYIVMEWAEGRLLRELLRQERIFPAGRAAHIAAADLRYARLSSRPRHRTSRSEAGKHHGRCQ